MNQPQVSVIILNWNRKEDTLDLLQQLKKQTYKVLEIIVVDNASTDSSVVSIKKHFPQVRIVQLKNNIALAGFNEGMKVAQSDYLLLLACDTVVTNNLVEKHIAKFKHNRKLGMSCPSTFAFESGKYLGPNRGIYGDNKKGYRVSYFDGNGICLRREVYVQTSGYALHYFICLEELEWAVRILNAGYDIRCFTDVVIYHKKSVIGGNYRGRQGFYYSRNWMWFYAQYIPFREMPRFLWQHFNSFVKKTKSSGTMRKRDCVLGIIASLKQLPLRSTATMAFVFLVICFSICSISITICFGSISHKTGTAPAKIIPLTLPAIVTSGMITSSPDLIPSANAATVKASVPLGTHAAYVTPSKRASFSSNCFVN